MTNASALLCLSVCINRSQPAASHTSPATFCAHGRKQATPIPQAPGPLDRSLHSSVMFAGHNANETTSSLLIHVFVFGALRGCLPVGLVHYMYAVRALSAVPLAALCKLVSGGVGLSSLTPCAWCPVRRIMDWTCRRRARGSPDVFLTPPTGGV